MTLGKAPSQSDMFSSGAELCEERLGESSVYRLLHRECHRLFPDELFADLFTHVGRRSVPPRIVAVVMVLQRLEGLSDRDAVDRFAFDLRWKYAAGGLEFDFPGFVHTVLVDMRARLRSSPRPRSTSGSRPLRSHTRTVPSTLAVTICVPSGPKSTVWTGPV
jgi:hypothetical protein